MKLACLALSFLAFCSTAASAENAWLADSITGCKAWADESSPSIRWDGQCKNGYASGKGVLHTLPPKQGRYEGEMVGGKLNGPVRGIVSDSTYVVGDYKEGKPVGIHTNLRKNLFDPTKPISISKYTQSNTDEYKNEYQGGNLVRTIYTHQDGKTSETRNSYKGGKLVQRIDLYIDGITKTREVKFEYQGGNLVRSISVDSYGNTDTEFKYQDGKLVRKIGVGVYGNTDQEFTYQDGKLVQTLYTDQDGKTSETKYEYQDGKLVRTLYTYRGGKPSETKYEYQDGKLVRTMVYADGNESSKTEYEDGKLVRYEGGGGKWEYQNGTLVLKQETFKRGDGSLTHTRKYQYQDGKLAQVIHNDGQSEYVHKYKPKFQNGKIVYEYEEVKAAERETPRPQESASTESPKDTDSGVGSFLGDLLGVVSSYHQGRGNTTKATQAEAVGAALSGDTARAESATSRLQAIASAEKAKKAQEQADKRAAQQAAQLQALQAAEAGRKAAPQQQYETAETYQPTYQTGGNTYESNSGGISGGGSAGSAGKSTSKSAGKKEVISTSVISHGYYDNGRYNGYRVIVRNTGNVKTACQVDIRYVRQFDPTAINTRTYVDYTVVPLIMNPGESSTAEVALSDQNLGFKEYKVKSCEKFMF